MIKYCTLANKATLVMEGIPYVRSAALAVFIKLGSRHEPQALSGASHFIEHMLFKGTQQRTAKQIAEKFERIGGQLNAYTSKEYTCVHARTLDENIFEAIDIILDMVLHSSFALKDFNTEKGVVIEEINMYEDTPDELIHDVFAQHLWQGQAMGSPILGKLNTVSSFLRDDIYNFYKSNYIPENIIVSVAGNIDSNRIKEAVNNHMEKAMPGTTSKADEHPCVAAPFVNLMEKDTEQIQICLGTPGISYYDSDRYTQHVMNSIFGGGISSRLFQSIREDLGLAYSVYSYPSSYSDTGAYSIYTGTGPNKIKQFFEVLAAEIDKIIKLGVTDEEVERTHQLLKSNLYLSLESVTNRSNRIGKSVLMYDKVVGVEDVMENILRVNAEMVQQYASRILDKKKYSLAAIGPAEVLNEAEKQFNKYFKGK